MAKAGRRLLTKTDDAGLAALDRLTSGFISLVETFRSAGLLEPRIPAPIDPPHQGTIAPPGVCPYCDNRRAEGAKAVRRHRAKRKELT